MIRQMDLIDMRSRPAKQRTRKQPPMLEALRLFSYETPQSIRITHMDFHRLSDRYDREAADIMAEKGMHYEVNVKGEIFSPYGNDREQLDDYMQHLMSIDFFNSLQLSDAHQDTETRTLSFALKALI